MSKILYVTTIDGTMYHFFIPHIAALQEEGHEVQVAFRPVRCASHFEELQYEVHHIPFNRNVLSLDNVRALPKLLRLYREERYDLVHVSTPVAAFLGRLAARLTGGIKTLYTAQGFHFVAGGGTVSNLVFLTLEKLAGYWTDGLIVNNAEDYAAARRHRLVADGRLYRVKGVGVDTDVFDPSLWNTETKDALKKQLGCGSNKVVGMIAEFIPRKRHVDLLLAAEKVFEEIDNVTFLFVSDGPLLSEMKDLAKAKLPEGKYRFLGRRADIPQLLSIMDVLVLPSLREGLPVSVQEAMAMATPVVATDVKGNQDLISHGETGLLVPRKNPDAIADALLRLLQDEHLAAKMGENGREVAIRELSLEKIVAQAVAVHKQVLEIA